MPRNLVNGLRHARSSSVSQAVWDFRIVKRLTSVAGYIRAGASGGVHRKAYVPPVR